MGGEHNLEACIGKFLQGFTQSPHTLRMQVEFWLINQQQTTGNLIILSAAHICQIADQGHLYGPLGTSTHLIKAAPITTDLIGDVQVTGLEEVLDVYHLQIQV
ncbi:hypothetical protein MARPU_15570 [Marichromatium purpuratum 984]|uniref:Uncharacterized protein n=1 Tax=Marichromatium purpuratum 984 TaxID=765910 RepID=W0E4H2_MARPU|nr:hypothetical protein MARPU_15570 [Marichromatium purpuratum 984]